MRKIFPLVSRHSRRHFLALAGGALACRTGPLSAEGGEARIKFAVKSRMVDEPDLDLTGRFALLREIGFDGVEWNGPESVEVAEIEKAIASTGLPVHGIVNAGSPEIAPAVEMAHRLGSESVLSFPEEDSDRSYEENFSLWQSRIREVLPLVEKREVFLCIENVRATFLKEAEEMARFLDSFDSPWVKSYFDTGNVITWTEQSAEHWVEVLGERIHKLDIKDRGHNEFGDPRIKREGVAGTDGGEVNWEEIRKLLAEQGFAGWATAEVRGGDRERLRRMLGWMRGVLGA